MKDAVLGLVVERRGYGYDLYQRFNDRFGVAWRLNPSTVYDALDKLAEQGYLQGVEKPLRASRSHPPRHRRVYYEATGPGRERFYNWLTAPTPQVEPVRAEIFLQIGLSKQDTALALINRIDAQMEATTDTLARHLASYRLDVSPRGEVAWEDAATWLINDAAIIRLQSDLTWLQRVRVAAESLRANGCLTTDELASLHRPMPPRWR